MLCVNKKYKITITIMKPINILIFIKILIKNVSNLLSFISVIVVF